MSLASLNDQALTAAFSTPYVPDFSVRVLTDVQYMCIRRAHYLVARRATLVERHHKNSESDSTHNVSFGAADDQFDKDWRRTALAMKLQSAALNESTLDGSLPRTSFLNSPGSAESPSHSRTKHASQNSVNQALDETAEKSLELNHSKQDEDVPLITPNESQVRSGTEGKDNKEKKSNPVS